MFKKLGMQIVVITVAAIVAVVAIMLTVTLISFSGYNDNLLKEKAEVGEVALETSVENELSTLELYARIFSEEDDFNIAVAGKIGRASCRERV